MRKTIQHIIRAALFLLIFLCLISVLAIVFVPKNNSRADGMDFAEANGILGEPENTIDVLYIGDSEVYNAISPMEIWNDRGITGYDCATGAQQILTSWHFVEQAFEKQSLKVVMVETNILFRRYGAEKWFEEQLRYLVPLFRYHDRWKNLGRKDLSLKTETTWTDPLKGFRLFKNVKGFEPDKNYRKPTDETARMNRFSKLYLEKMQELCAAHGAQLVLFTVPTTKNWNFKRHNSVQQYADANGLTYLDMNLLPEEEFSIDWSTDTKDKGDHLNFDGAMKASAYIADFLADTYGIEDHRADPDYQHWFTYWDTYSTLVAQE